MPYFGLFVPNPLINVHPSIGEYLILNENRLTTWYDIHSMLKDIAKRNFTHINDTLPDRHVYSPWRQEVPMSRTCESAMIPAIYCVCNHHFKKVSAIEKLHFGIAEDLVSYINDETEVYRNVCSFLQLKNIRSLFNSFDGDNADQLIRITISVKPSNAIFRAVFTQSSNGAFYLSDGVTRLNSYNNQSWCTMDQKVKPFCYCNP